MAELRLVGAVGIKVRPQAKDFRKELKDQLRNLPDEKVKVTVEADTTKAERDLERLQEHDGDTIELLVGVNYDSIQKARKDLQNKLARLEDERDGIIVPVRFDETGLRNALRKLKDAAQDANVRMDYTDDEEGFRSVLAKIARIRAEKVAKEVEFYADDESLDEVERDMRSRLAEIESKRTVDITYRDDRDSLERAIAQIDEELAKLKQLTISPVVNQEALQEAKEELTRELRQKPVSIGISDDLDGYKKALKAIEELRAKAAEVEFKFQTDNASLELAAAEAQAKIDELTPKAKVEFKYDSDTLGLNAALAEVDAELKKLRQVTITADLDEEGLLKVKRELEQLRDNSSFDINVNTDDVAALTREREKLNQLLKDKQQTTTLTVNADEQSLEDARTNINKLIAEAEQRRIQLPVQTTGLLVAAQELAFLSRARTVPFYIRINQKSAAIAEGIIKSLAGYNTLSSLGRGVEGLLTNFDNVILKIGGVTAALGTLTSVGLTATTGILSIGEGVLKTAGLLALAPTAIGAITSGFLVYSMGLNNFAKSWSDIPIIAKTALAKLPPIAREARDALDGTWTSISDPVQEKFWEQMGESLVTLSERVIPPVREGLVSIAPAIGLFTRNVLDSFTKIADNGELKTMFSNIEGYFNNASGAATPFFDAFNTFGLRGSEYLPRFGGWLTDISTQFNNWTQNADKMGLIDKWIQEGVQSLTEMWSIGGSVTRMLGGLYKAADIGGTPDIRDFADRLNGIANTMNREPFLTRMGNIFRGGRAGAGEFNQGLQDVIESLGEASEWFAEILTLSGKLSGVTLTNLTAFFDSGRFRTGSLDALNGMVELLEELSPSFKNAATIAGNLGTVAGSAFRNLAPLINTVSGALADVTSILKDDLAAFMPTLLLQMTGTFTAISTVVVGLAEAISTILDAFNSIPGGIQTMLLAFAAFTIMRGQISSLFTALNNSKPFKSLENNWRLQQSLAGSATAATDKFRASHVLVGNMRNSLGNIRTEYNNVATAAQNSDRQTRTFARGLAGMGVGGITKGLGGLSALLGGPWGIAITAATVGFSLFAAKQRDAKQAVQEVSDTLDTQTGAITDNTAALIAKKIVDDEGSAGIKTSSEVIKTLGKSIQETAQITAAGGKPFDEMIDKLKRGRGAAQEMAMKFDESGNATRGNADAWKAWTAEMGIADDALNSMEIDLLIQQLEAERSAVQNSQNSWGLRNDAIDTSTVFNDGLRDSLDKVSDSAADTETRIDAYKDALDRLNGVNKPLQEIQRDMAKTDRDLRGFLAATDEYGNKINTNLVDLSTGFALNTEAGDELNTMLMDLQTQSSAASIAAYDAAGGAKNHAEATAAATAAVQPFRTQLQQMVVDGLLTQQQVDAISTALFGVPGSTPFEVTDRGSIRGIAAQLSDLHSQIQRTPDKSIKVTEPLSPAVIKGLEKLGYVVTHLPDGTIQVGETGTSATGQKIDNVAGKQRVANITAQAFTGAAQSALDGLTAERTAYIKAITYNGGTVGAGKREITNADGNILTSMRKYANGGFENHTAQIAYSSPQYPVRVWAEGETGGEAYIPLAVSKRTRSTAIWKETGKRLGVYADGGFNGGSSLGGAPVNITINSVPVNHAQETAETLLFHLRHAQRGGVYSGIN